MMNKNSKLTKNGERNVLQCYYNNVGICIFKDQCIYQHFKKVYSKSICQDKKWKFRHPKCCKLGDRCKFHKQNNLMLIKVLRNLKYGAWKKAEEECTDTK